MSVRVMSAVFDLDGLQPASKLLLLVLADHADDYGRCWPSRNRVAEKAGVTGRTVTRMLEGLAAAGFLEVENRPGRTHLYRVLPGALDPGQNVQGEPLDPGQNVHTPWTQLCPHTLDTAVSTEPSRTVREPSEPEPEDSPDSWHSQLGGQDLPPGWAPLVRPWTFSTPTGDRDQLYDTLLQVCSGDGGIPKTSHSYVSKFVEELRSAGATPGEIRARARHYRTRLPYKEWAFTPAALVKYWPFLTDQSEKQLDGHRCPPHRWTDMGDDQRGRYCLACRTWEKETP